MLEERKYYTLVCDAQVDHENGRDTRPCGAEFPAASPSRKFMISMATHLGWSVAVDGTVWCEDCTDNKRRLQAKANAFVAKSTKEKPFFETLKEVDAVLKDADTKVDEPPRQPEPIPVCPQCGHGMIFSGSSDPIWWCDRCRDYQEPDAPPKCGLCGAEGVKSDNGPYLICPTHRHVIPGTFRGEPATLTRAPGLKCPDCKVPAEWRAGFNRWVCPRCLKNVEGPSKTPAKPPKRTQNRCPKCSEVGAILSGLGRLANMTVVYCYTCKMAWEPADTGGYLEHGPIPRCHDCHADAAWVRRPDIRGWVCLRCNKPVEGLSEAAPEAGLSGLEGRSKGGDGPVGEEVRLPTEFRTISLGRVARIPAGSTGDKALRRLASRKP